MGANEHFMQRCLELARRGRGLVGNGAMVSAVVVSEGKIIAEAFHEGFGKPHAEQLLVENVDQKSYSGSTLYVNLEPCVHYGKTPPCTERIIESGIRKVVVGMRDPDPRVDGKGIEALRDGGIEVIGPVLLAQCEKLNRGFQTVRRFGRPWITLKRAQTKGGAIARDDGSPMKITSSEQDRMSHIFERAQADAILAGVETVIRDNPHLTVRYGTSTRQPWRIILDPQLRVPMEANVCIDEYKNQTIILTSLNNYSDQYSQLDTGFKKKLESLQSSGIHVFQIPADDKKFVWPALWKSLTESREDFHGLTSILVEGGNRTWDIFQKAGFVDEEIILVGE